jgi:hypothetical protein
MFIKLSQFMGYFKERAPVQSVWVNPDHITYITTWTKEVLRYDLEVIEGKTQKVMITTTILSFVAGLQEESDSVSVLETPDMIMQIIREVGQV